MNENIKVEKVIEAVYTEMVDSISDDICLTCPVVRGLRDLKDTIKEANHDMIIRELGLSFGNMEFPCMKEKHEKNSDKKQQMKMLKKPTHFLDEHL